MQRYDLKYYQLQNDFSDEIEESENGFWVKFEDAIKHGVNELSRGMDLGIERKPVSLDGYSGECNCEEMSHRKQVLKVDVWNWICPAHGYKNL